MAHKRIKSAHPMQAFLDEGDVLHLWVWSLVGVSKAGREVALDDLAFRDEAAAKRAAKKLGGSVQPTAVLLEIGKMVWSRA